MKHLLFIILLALCANVSGQKNIEQYNLLIKKADSLYTDSQFKLAAAVYEEAFASTGGLGKVKDRYKAATSWTLSGDKDKALINLERIAFKGGFTNVEMLLDDSVFKVLHTDPRWLAIINQIKENGKKKQ